MWFSSMSSYLKATLQKIVPTTERLTGQQEILNPEVYNIRAKKWAEKIHGPNTLSVSQTSLRTAFTRRYCGYWIIFMLWYKVQSLFLYLLFIMKYLYIKLGQTVQVAADKSFIYKQTVFSSAKHISCALFINHTNGL